MLSSPHTLVIVDDNEEVTFVLQQIIDSIYGDQVNIKSFSSSEKALDYVAHHDIRILISDLELPGLHGVDLIEKVNNLNRGILTIVITGHQSYHTALECFMNGTEGYINKPLTSKKIQTALDQCFSKIEYWRQTLETVSDI
jgi:two-component system response regulator YesN